MVMAFGAFPALATGRSTVDKIRHGLNSPQFAGGFASGPSPLGIREGQGLVTRSPVRVAIGGLRRRDAAAESFFFGLWRQHFNASLKACRPDCTALSRIVGPTLWAV